MSLDQFVLDGKTALVTGGGTGIGFGIASGLLEAGARIACIYRNHGPEALEALGRERGVEVFSIKADLESPGEADRVFNETIAHFGTLDILVNNAGICPRANALEYPEDMWNQIIQVNQTVVFRLSQLAARHFVEHGIKG